jgi:hypothetical protein
MVQENLAVDYQKIDRAVRYYEYYGYRRVNAPWFVSRKAMEVTAPPGLRFCSSFLGDLVASGEQSFIQMWMDGNLGVGKWQCVTPCFRDEPVINDFRLNYFFKVELIDVMPDDRDESIKDMLKIAIGFFSYYVGVVLEPTKIGTDIVANDIELGSYGYREYGDFKWVYGTGVAEPRLSYVEKVMNTKLGDI